MTTSQKKLGIISDITFDLVAQKIRTKLPQDIVFVKYGDIASLLLSDSDLYATDYLLLHCDTQFNRYPQATLSAIGEALGAFVANYTGTLIVSRPNPLGSHSILSSEPGRPAFSIPDSPHVLYFDFGSLVAEIGTGKAYHYAMGHLYQMPYTQPLIRSWSKGLIDYFRFLEKPEKKAIVLDCDNTLWGGILGEDGHEGLKINKNADGILYHHFQLWLKEKQAEGFLLCLCTKNNESDVREWFEKGKMPLRWEDFIVKKANWDDKYINLNDIASALNIGTEALIFIDDNPFEIESIKELMPETECVTFTNDYADFLTMTQHYAFKRKRVLDADKEKHAQYLNEQKRNLLKEQSTFEQYIASLGIETTVSLNDMAQLERYAQMTEKTNQFNFNKRPLGPGELKAFVEAGNYIFGLSVADKFGDYGIVGLILAAASPAEGKSTLINFLMSCRALGRGIEDRFFQETEQQLSRLGFPIAEVLFEPTDKNAPAKKFYEQIKKAR